MSQSAGPETAWLPSVLLASIIASAAIWCNVAMQSLGVADHPAIEGLTMFFFALVTGSIFAGGRRSARFFILPALAIALIATIGNALVDTITMHDRFGAEWGVAFAASVVVLISQRWRKIGNG